MNYYRASVRELQRLSSKGASPIYANFDVALSGISTIRAFSKQVSMVDENRELLGSFLRPTYLQQMSGQWLSIRLTCIGAAIVGATAALAVWEYGAGEASKAAIVGFALNS